MPEWDIAKQLSQRALEVAEQARARPESAHCWVNVPNSVWWAYLIAECFSSQQVNQAVQQIWYS